MRANITQIAIKKFLRNVPWPSNVAKDDSETVFFWLINVLRQSADDAASRAGPNYQVDPDQSGKSGLMVPERGAVKLQ